MLLPPPHIILQDIPGTLKFFDRSNKVGMLATGGGSSALLATIAFTTMRVVLGLSFGFVGGLFVGAAVHYFKWVRRLVLPTITLLSPVSPIAWLPVAIFIFGIGNAPAIFMVVVALFFHMVLATISQIDGVTRNLINVARTMGATKRQIYWRVIVPAILPGMLAVLRINLFGAWMVVLIAESTGVGYGMGQVIMLARNTFNSLAGVLHHRGDRRAGLHCSTGCCARPSGASSTGCPTGRRSCVASEHRFRLLEGRRGLPRRRQDLGGRHQARARGAARHRSRRRAGRVRGPPRARRAAASAPCST